VLPAGAPPEGTCIKGRDGGCEGGLLHVTAPFGSVTLVKPLVEVEEINGAFNVKYGFSLLLHAAGFSGPVQTIVYDNGEENTRVEGLGERVSSVSVSFPPSVSSRPLLPPLLHHMLCLHVNGGDGTM
jgi:hypothetical protein